MRTFLKPGDEAVVPHPSFVVYPMIVQAAGGIRVMVMLKDYRLDLDAMARARIPYVGSVGAADMVNFWAMATVPERFRGRNLYRHNPNVTLMRTTPEECARIGRFVVEKLNRMDGPVRFLIPEGGLSGLDQPGGPFWDPAADKALFDAISGEFRSSSSRKLIRLRNHVNDPAFAEALVAHFEELTATWPASHARTS